MPDPLDRHSKRSTSCSIALLPDNVVLQLDGLAERERRRRKMGVTARSAAAM
jgi:hypothetical protein